jgi:ubiquinone/menaquinone biosynthesis C-methylase UbiE
MIIQIIFIILGFFLLLWICLRIATMFADIPAPAFLGPLLNSDIRRLVQPPDNIIKSSGIKEGMRVLDLGCGSGAYTTFMARAVGKMGKVYALDFQQGMLNQLAKKLSRPEKKDITNVEIVRADARDLPFENGFFDLVIMIGAFQEMPEREKVLAGIERVLKPGGILAISEALPDPDFPLKATTIRMVEEGGFRVEAVEGSFWNYTVRTTRPLR